MRKLVFLTILISLFFTNSFAYEFTLNSKDKNLINNSKQKSAILKNSLSSVENVEMLTTNDSE